MTIYVDDVRHYPNARWTRKHWCHMVTDGPLDELHAMAAALGLPLQRLHSHRVLQHYDLIPELRERAIELGAVPIARRDLVELIRRVRAVQVVGRAQLDGIAAVESIAEHVRDWNAPTPCAEWDATMLAAHLRATAARHLELLSEARAGRVTTLVIDDDLARRNRAAIDALDAAEGPEHIAHFAQDARAFARDVAGLAGAVVQRWPDGRELQGRDLAGVAVVEWHVHAWDLARSAGHDYAPARPDVVADAWRSSILHIELGEGEPWMAVLRACGR